ncbi:MAG: NAD(P)/FAD-dependent oxidoreductase [Myxococcota bacterium]
MSETVDAAFLRRAVAACDLAALRAALYQATRDPELASFGPVAGLDEAGTARLAERAVELLEAHASGFERRVPSDDEVRELMDLVLGVPTRDAHFEVRKKFLAFTPFPFLHERPDGAAPVPEGFEVAIIGAGPAGIAMAVQLGRLGIPYVLYDRRDEIGGTWSIHKYPDIRVDTLSLHYEFSFDEPYRWREYFARGEQVRGYLEHIAEKHGVRPHMRLGHDLEDARFDEATSSWQLVFRGNDGERVERRANVVVSAAGLFSKPKRLDIEGIDAYEGGLVHPTRWTNDIDVRGKRVAVIGNGSSGVQLLARVANEAAQVHVFQRTPQWIAPRPNYGRPIEPEVRWLLDHVPGYWNWCRYTSIIGLMTWHEDFLIPDEQWEAKGGYITEKSEQLREFMVDYIQQQIGDRPDLFEQLVPDYAPMVRRPVVDNGWYQALTRDNVELVTSGIERFTKRGIETADGKQHEFDLVVSATGFEVDQFLWPAEYHGEGGVRLRDYWAPESPRAYLGMMVPHFPNFFMLYGPNSQPVSGGISLLSWFQIWAAYVAQCLDTMFEEGHAQVSVTEDAYQTYNEETDAVSSELAFVKDKRSVDRNYYVDAHGRLLVNTPYETAELYAMMKEPKRDELAFGASTRRER